MSSCVGSQQVFEDFRALPGKRTQNLLKKNAQMCYSVCDDDRTLGD